MTIRLNGEVREVADGTSVAELLEALDLQRPGVAVAIGGRVIPRSRHAGHLLAAGDEVEVIRAVGGG